MSSPADFSVEEEGGRSLLRFTGSLTLARLGDLSERSERYDVLPADLAQVQAYVTAAVAHR
jgi:hypothetical protein